MIRHASAVWNGSGKEGKGQVSTSSGALNNTPYNYRMRFENDPGTNPEELIAAAHASCFSMKLSFILGEMGVTPEQIDTKCEITFEGGVLKQSRLIVKSWLSFEVNPHYYQEFMCWVILFEPTIDPSSSN